MNVAANDPSGNVAATANDVVEEDTTLTTVPGGDAASPPSDPLPVASAPQPVAAPVSLSPEEQMLSQIVTTVGGSLAAPGVPSTWLSFALMEGHAAFPALVPVHEVATMLNEVGIATVAANLRDVQFWNQRRTAKRADGLEAVYGVVVEADRQAADALGEFESRGLPGPTAGFLSLNGFKGVLSSADEFSLADARELAQRITLSIEGDPKSWELSQAQRLPICLKTTQDAGIVLVQHPAVPGNGVPFAPNPLVAPFPSRVLRALGAAAISHADRERIREYLDDLGIPAPTQGSKLYDACPEQSKHDSRCCYVNVEPDGRLWVHCLGGHGPRTWRERDLLRLATLNEPTPIAGEDPFDPLEHLPVTYAGVGYAEEKLAAWEPADRDAAIELWRRERARREARDGVSIELVELVHHRRLFGHMGVPVHRPYYDVLNGEVRVVDRGSRRYTVAGSRGLNKKNSFHALIATTGYVATMRVDKKTGQEIPEPGWRPDADALFQSAAGGHRDILHVLGLPAMYGHDYPVAFLNREWRIAPSTMHLERSDAAATLDDVEEVSPVDFFMAAFHARRIPLATPNDVLLLIAAIASPLLREMFTGQLGVYWIIGPSGVGKEYLCTIVTSVWNAANPNGPGASFEVLAAGDLELKRAMEGAKGAVFARIKEAAKRGEMLINELIRLSGTDQLPSRGVGKAEIRLPNVFTYLADSAEDVPNRREISRRTLVIRAAPSDDRLPKGAFLEDVRKNARGMLLWLQRRIENQGRDWFLQQADTGSRPLVPVALTRMLGATLPGVEGENLDELFEAMLAYIRSDEGKTEGSDRLAVMKRRSSKESLFSTTFPSYRFSRFAGEFRALTAYRELIDSFGKSSKNIAVRIARETDYAIVASGSAEYHAVEINGDRYAFRMEGSNQRFILYPEVAFLTLLAQQRAGGSKATTASVASIPSRNGGAPAPVPVAPPPNAATVLSPKVQP